MIVMWLLIAVLPIQGIAAATMISCGAAHKASLEGMATVLPDHHHAEAAPVHHHDDDADQKLNTDDQERQPDGDQVGADHKHGPSSCSACGACCIGTAMLPATPDWLPQHNDSEPVLSLPASAILSHISAGLERPPRFASA